jgi:hypothetical protein
MRRTRCWVCVGSVLALAGCTSSTTVAPAPVAIEQVLDIRQVGAPFWAPDGTTIGFVWTRGTERELWAADPGAAEPGASGHPTLRQLAPLAGRSGAVVSPDWRARSTWHATTASIPRASSHGAAATAAT